MTLDLIKNKKYFLGFSAIIVLISWAFIIVFGFRPGFDLRGGARMTVTFKNPADVIKIESVLKTKGGVEGAVVKQSGENVIINLPDTSEENHQKYLEVLKSDVGELTEKSFSAVGSAIGAELRRKSIWAAIIIILAISLYVAWAFRKVSQPVASWKYGMATLIALAHDVSIAAGLLAFLGWYKGVEMDANLVVALLVIMAFSVQDTIVVFDRIRENLLSVYGKKVSLADVINRSVNETMVRSFNTSLTIILVLIALIAVGPIPLFYFILTILIGMIFGTYSSIFVASPVLYLWQSDKSQ